MEDVIIILIIVAIVVVYIISEKNKLNAMSPQEREKYRAAKKARRANILLTLTRGPRNTSMVCPHCNEKGKIRTKTVRRKKGISGGKATAALLTGGLSMFATGLSRKAKQTEAHCSNCNNTWDF